MCPAVAGVAAAYAPYGFVRRPADFARGRPDGRASRACPVEVVRGLSLRRAVVSARPSRASFAPSLSRPMSKKIEPTGAGRHEERAEHETDESASVDGGDDQQREADADEGEREDRRRRAVQVVHAAARAPTT